MLEVDGGVRLTPPPPQSVSVTGFFEASRVKILKIDRAHGGAPPTFLKIIKNY